MAQLALLGVVATATTEEKSVRVLMLRRSRYRIEGDVAVRHEQMGTSRSTGKTLSHTRFAKLSYSTLSDQGGSMLLDQHPGKTSGGNAMATL
ncbi:hypothetical protein UPYG_G00162890 [Umbra pygmaea]|uniref:Secreted protein n=1 Tax=Umbra pygmaea TaxID=75934 RepID=A0ABD0WLZ0_UMBPY